MPDPGLTSVLRESLRHCFQSRPFQEVLYSGVLCQQCLHFLSQGFIAGTGSFQKCSKLLPIAFSGGVIQLLNSLRAFCRRTYLLFSIHEPTKI